MTKRNKGITLPNPTVSKFIIDECVLIEVRSDYVGRDIWVGRIIGIEGSTYIIKSLSTDARFCTRVPFLFENLMSRVEPERLDATIKALKVLYYR